MGVKNLKGWEFFRRRITDAKKNASKNAPTGYPEVGTTDPFKKLSGITVKAPVYSIYLIYFIITQFQGVFGNGKFENLEDLIKVVSSTIFMCSVSHAAANFAQYDEYAFPPNYPGKLKGDIIRDKVLHLISCFFVRISKFRPAEPLYS